MKLEVIWSDFAETQLDEIYEYYEKKVGKGVAIKPVREIINEPQKLIKLSLIGQEDELLKEK